MPKPACLVILEPDHAPFFYGAEEWGALAERVELLAERPLSTAEALADPARLARVEILFSGWGGPPLSADFLAQLPRLRAVFFAGGTVKGHIGDAFWARAIPIVSAAAANARPVAEYTVAALVFGLKGFVPRAAALRDGVPWGQSRAWPGTYRTTVGLVSFGAIAREVRRLLGSFSVDVLVHDPYLTANQARAHDVTPVPLDELFSRSHAVSIHAPSLPETAKMIREEHLLRLPPHATFINSARGAVIDQPGLVFALTARPDIQAFLDVTSPEPPPPDSPLRTLPNVFLTPHVAGSIGPECRRMTRLLLDELDQFLAGQPLRHAVRQADFAISA
ncbi:MAG: hydroxyacid dehydrogenase [Burkholderiales bacterium]|nr:hydroxyacid dehydrogenase [Opitutaceae bacterium]